MKYILILSILFIPFYASGKCINASDITQTEIVDVVEANSGANTGTENGCSSHWVKSKVKLKDVERLVNIVDTKVNLCAKGNGSNESESIELSIDGGHGIRLVELHFNQYDSVHFSVLPSIQGKITTEICNGGDDNIKVFDMAKCKTDFVGLSYSSIISNDILSPKSNVSVPGAGQKWIDGPLYVIDVTDSDGHTVASKAMASLGEKVSSSDELFREICHYDPVHTRQGLKVDIENIRSGLTSYELNKMCGNLCHVKYNEEGKQLSVVSNNCAYTVSSEITNGTTYTYLPGVVAFAEGQVIKDSIAGVASPQGLLLDKEYELNSSLPIVHIGGVTRLGGYKVLVSRRCTYHNKRSLYYHVGDSCPTMMPGEDGTFPIEMIDNDGNYTTRRSFKIDTAWAGQSIYYGVKDNGDGYANNVGHFNLTTRVPKDLKSPFSKVISWVLKYVNRLLYADRTSTNSGAVGVIYHTLIDGPFVKIVQSVLILYIAVYALLYIMGMLKSSQMEVLVVLVKVSIVFVMIGPDSFRFFNENLFTLFTDGTTDLINIMSSDEGTESENRFHFVDKGLSRFAETGTWVQIFSIIFTGPLGFIIAFAIVWGVYMLFIAILRAVIIFIISIIIVALLLSIAPLFVSFILFKRTKVLFENWIKILASTAFQPIMVFTMIAMLNDIIMGVTYALFNYDVCTQCLAMVSIHNKVDVLCLFNTYLPRAYIATSGFADLARDTYDGFTFFGVPILLPSLMAFVIICHAVSAFIQKVPEIVSDLFGVISTEITGPAKAFEDTARSIVAQDSNKQGGDASSENTRKLHDEKAGTKDEKTKARAKTAKGQNRKE